MENGTLLSYAEKCPQHILKLLNESAQGLHYLHTSNIVHGDLKAVNILVCLPLPRPLWARFNHMRLHPRSMQLDVQSWQISASPS